MARSTLPLFPSDDGWPYPDGSDPDASVDLDVDIDALAIDDHTFAALTPTERYVLRHRFGFGNTPESMSAIASELQITKREVAEILGTAIHKVRQELI